MDINVPDIPVQEPTSPRPSPSKGLIKVTS